MFAKVTDWKCPKCEAEYRDVRGQDGQVYGRARGCPCVMFEGKIIPRLIVISGKERIALFGRENPQKV